MKFDVKDISLHKGGLEKIEWARKEMPVLNLIRERFRKEKPLKNVKIGACLHVTSETANLVDVLKEGGAEVALCASNPLSTQDDVAAAIVKIFSVPVFAIRGVDRRNYYQHIKGVISIEPDITIDDGADLITTIHNSYQHLLKKVKAGMEETTTGVIRLRAMAKDGALKYPVIAVNNALTKFLFDNRYGTGQSTLDGIIRATNMLIAGKCVVVCGYGWCGRGVAMRARGMGARVIVTEVDPIKALEAVMDGFEVMPIAKAAPIGDIFCTLTGNKSVIHLEHFKKMKDNAIVCNSGHFNVEIDIPALEKFSRKVRKGIRGFIDEYSLKNGRKINLLAEGRLVNLACAEGHPSSVMDMSFSTQALTAEYVIKLKSRLPNAVHNVPQEIERKIANLKLKSMGISIDKLTPEQKRYISGWQEGT